MQLCMKLLGIQTEIYRNCRNQHTRHPDSFMISKTTERHFPTATGLLVSQRAAYQTTHYEDAGKSLDDIFEI